MALTQNRRRGQGAFEYILLVGGAILFVILVLAVLRGNFFTPAGNHTNASTNSFYNYLATAQASAQAQGRGQYYGPTRVTACGFTVTNDSLLTQNVSLVSISGAPCITIGANNVVVDCQGFTIDGGASSAKGVFADNKQGVTVKNCYFKDVDYGVYFTSDNFSTASNNRFWRSITQDLYFSSGNNNTISGNVELDCTTRACNEMVYVNSETGDTVSSNTVVGKHNGPVIRFFAVTLSRITGNLAAYLSVPVGSSVIQLMYKSSNNTVTSNNASFNGLAYGVEIRGVSGIVSKPSDYNTVTGNTLNDNAAAVNVFFGTRNAITNNNASNALTCAITFAGSGTLCGACPASPFDGPPGSLVTSLTATGNTPNNCMNP